jgi:hypothetical protein
MKKTGIGLVIMLIIGASLYLFYFLGGFNEIQVSTKNLGQIELIGIHYKGTPQNEELGQAFKKIEMLKNQHDGAILHTIYYVEPAGKLDTMEVFVGIERNWLVDEKDFDLISYDGSQAIVAEIKANRFVMPGPKKVKSKIADFANGSNLAIPNLYIDQIIGTDEVKVIGINE